MSSVCAKPACAEPAAVWFDFAPGTRAVMERVQPTEVSVGLCSAHAGRFSVPDGWSLQRLDSERGRSGESDDVPEAAEPRSSPVDDGSRTGRVHERGRPWFLARTEDSETVRADADRLGDADSAADADFPEESELTAGSLLHRAFHGPDRATDIARAEREHLDELESRRSAKASPNRSERDTTAELPFPPFEPEQQAAVS